MNVKELIEKLKEMDQESEIVIETMEEELEIMRITSMEEGQLDCPTRYTVIKAR